jgi:hypothetical protein
MPGSQTRRGIGAHMHHDTRDGLAFLFAFAVFVFCFFFIL